jgi:hypothetical protein
MPHIFIDAAVQWWPDRHRPCPCGNRQRQTLVALPCWCRCGISCTLRGGNCGSTLVLSLIVLYEQCSSEWIKGVFVFLGPALDWICKLPSRLCLLILESEEEMPGIPWLPHLPCLPPPSQGQPEVSARKEQIDTLGCLLTHSDGQAPWWGLT